MASILIELNQQVVNLILTWGKGHRENSNDIREEGGRRLIYLIKKVCKLTKTISNE